jgi:hypothetical protein
MVKELTSNAPKARPKRTPIASRNILSVAGKDPDRVYRIVNDDPGRIEAFKEAGYELVPDAKVKVGDTRVDNASSEGSYAQVNVGGGKKAFVMSIRREWYNEDQAAKQTEINKLEQSTRQQALAQNDLKNGKLEISRD